MSASTTAPVTNTNPSPTADNVGQKRKLLTDGTSDVPGVAKIQRLSDVSLTSSKTGTPKEGGYNVTQNGATADGGDCAVSMPPGGGNSLPSVTDGGEPDRNSIYLLSRNYTNVDYTFISRTGPSHRPEFTMEVKVNGQTFRGCGPSMNKAKMVAADCAWSALRSSTQGNEEMKTLPQVKTETPVIPKQPAVTNLSKPAGINKLDVTAARAFLSAKTITGQGTTGSPAAVNKQAAPIAAAAVKSGTGQVIGTKVSVAPEAAIKSATGPAASVKPGTVPASAIKPATGHAAVTKPATGPAPVTKSATGQAPVTKPAAGPAAFIQSSTGQAVTPKHAVGPTAIIKPIASTATATKPATDPATDRGSTIAPVLVNDPAQPNSISLIYQFFPEIAATFTDTSEPSIGGAVGLPCSFSYTLTMHNGQPVRGTASTKKQAKHECASAAVELLRSSGAFDKRLAEKGKKKTFKQRGGVEEIMKAKLELNQLRCNVFSPGASSTTAATTTTATLSSTTTVKMPTTTVKMQADSTAESKTLKNIMSLATGGDTGLPASGFGGRGDRGVVKGIGISPIPDLTKRGCTIAPPRSLVEKSGRSNSAIALGVTSVGKNTFNSTGKVNLSGFGGRAMLHGGRGGRGFERGGMNESCTGGRLARGGGGSGVVSSATLPGRRDFPSTTFRGARGRVMEGRGGAMRRGGNSQFMGSTGGRPGGLVSNNRSGEFGTFNQMSTTSYRGGFRGGAAAGYGPKNERGGLGNDFGTSRWNKSGPEHGYDGPTSGYGIKEDSGYSATGYNSSRGYTESGGYGIKESCYGVKAESGRGGYGSYARVQSYEKWDQSGANARSAAGGYGTIGATGYGSIAPAAASGYGSTSGASAAGYGSTTAAGYGSTTPAAVGYGPTKSAGGYGSIAAVGGGYGPSTVAGDGRYGSTAATGYGSSGSAGGGYGPSAAAVGDGYGSTATGYGSTVAAGTGYGLASGTGYGSSASANTGYGLATAGYGSSTAADSGYGLATAGYGSSTTANSGYGQATAGYGSSAAADSGYGLTTAGYGSSAAAAGSGYGPIASSSSYGSGIAANDYGSRTAVGATFPESYGTSGYDSYSSANTALPPGSQTYDAQSSTDYTYSSSYTHGSAENYPPAENTYSTGRQY